MRGALRCRATGLGTSLRSIEVRRRSTTAPSGEGTVPYFRRRPAERGPELVQVPHQVEHVGQSAGEPVDPVDQSASLSAESCQIRLGPTRRPLTCGVRFLSGVAPRRRCGHGPYRGGMPASGPAPKLLVTGVPKSGKTTAVIRLVELLRQAGVPVGGFVTSEQRVDGRRVGFIVQNLAGPSGLLAHQDLDSPVRVGRFRVDVPAFERIALPALNTALAGDGIVVVDEIARMELASAAFVALVEEVLDSQRPVVATVHAHPHPFTDAINQRPDVLLLEVDDTTRDDLPKQLLALLTGR